MPARDHLQKPSATSTTRAVRKISTQIAQKRIKAELYHDSFQNFKRYNIPKAQLVIADIPYNLGVNAYASSTEWYIDGDNKNGESKKAGKPFFNTDSNFKIAEYMHFCSRLLKKEPKEKGKAPAMIVFCAFEQIPMVVNMEKIRVQAKLSDILYQELFSTGAKGKYENRRSYRTRGCAVSRQTTKV